MAVPERCELPGVVEGVIDAMILAAGFGTRLRPLTDTVPKALVEVGGIPQLERCLRAVEAAGADRVVVNTHHHADLVEEWIEARGVGPHVIVSREEPEPLETGGGLLAARRHFRGDRPVLVHNVDVITSIDLAALVSCHGGQSAPVTLAVQERAASRYLLFDDAGLFGRLDVRTGALEQRRQQRGPRRRLAFTGVHVLTPTALDAMSESGRFSIIDGYLRLAGEGTTIVGRDVGAAEWYEIGTPERLNAARERFGGRARL